MQKLGTKSSLITIKSDKTKRCVRARKSASEDFGKEKKIPSDLAFQNWLRHKMEEQLRKRENERLLKEINEEAVKIKKEAAELSFVLWKHRKDKIRKGEEEKETQLKKEKELKKNLKRQVSKERVSQWMRTSKYKPLPIPNNQGLLSLTSNPPSFFNPRPWVSVI